MLGYVRGAIAQQKSYLLSARPAWQLGGYVGNSNISALHTVKDIYDFTTNHLTYSLNRISDGFTRLGAQKALSSPEEAVCTEYADVFVALAREKGIYAREIEGYAYAFDPQLQPLSLRTDVLHAWPEFYDNARQTWLPVDPTWQDTSGIDYFSAMDFSHIVFAIHGKDDTYPLPAGSYKYEDSIDVQVTPTSKTLPQTKSVEVQADLPMILSQGKKYTAMLSIRNSGNVFLHDLSLTAYSQGVSIQFSEPVIALLAPGQVAQVPLEVSSTHIGKKDITIQVGGMYDKTISVTFQQSWKALLLPGSIGILVLLLVAVLTALRRHTHHHDHKRAHTRHPSK
ncbi:MAG: Transglutaminase-like superfamily protein [Microgenomates bacterium OLB22]|nr:MAG: Transglutaminase-like superfamily protein [Microgenomates bacterium OLB22]